jgi:hypothetical protein
MEGLWKSHKLEVDFIKPSTRSKTQTELFEIFPQGKRSHKRRLKIEKSDLGEQLDSMQRARREMVYDEIPDWFIELYDKKIEEVQKRYDQLNFLLKPGERDGTNKLEQAKLYPIVDVLGITATRKLMKIRCVLHEEKTPSMAIYTETNKFHCFGCGDHGDVIDLYSKLHGVTLSEAIKALV